MTYLATYKCDYDNRKYCHDTIINAIIYDKTYNINTSDRVKI